MKHFFALILFISISFSALSQTETDLPIVYRINIKENIGSNTWVFLRNGLHEAQQLNAACVILHMNTYGGSVVEADSMRTAILHFPLPVYVFIDNNAASAGALISIACDSIFMRSSATIGAATVVQGGDGTKASDKMQSYMRGMMRATAESHGKIERVENGDTVSVWRRDPQIAEAFVGGGVAIPGVVDSTRVLTLTASQAVALGFCDGIVESIEELITEHLGFTQFELITYQPTLFDRIKGFLTNGILQAFLIMFIIGGIYMELQSPGVGLPSAVAITAAILYFTPLYLTGYAQSWEVIIFVVGLILIVFELFVIPGFGVAGITGIVFVFTSLILALIDNVKFNFEGVSALEMFRAIMIVLGGMGMGMVFVIYMSSRIGKPGVFRKVALNADQEGFVSVSLEPIAEVGKTGVAATVLRPSGKVSVDGELYDAVSMKGFIEKGDEVEVKRYENFQLYVVKK